MSEPITKPQAAYSLLPEADKKIVDLLLESLVKRAHLPSLKRLPPPEAKKCALGLIDLGLLKVCQEDGKAWLEIHNGKGYVRV